MANKLTLNVSAWTLVQYNQYARFLNEGKFFDAFKLARRIIVSWDYPSDLSADNPWEKIDLLEGVEMLHAIRDTINAAVEAANLKEYPVNLKLVPLPELFEFQDARAAGDFATVERVLRLAVTIPHDDVTHPLLALPGAIALIAFDKAFGKALSGKN